MKPAMRAETPSQPPPTSGSTVAGNYRIVESNDRDGGREVVVRGRDLYVALRYGKMIRRAAEQPEPDQLLQQALGGPSAAGNRRAVRGHRARRLAACRRRQGRRIPGDEVGPPRRDGAGPAGGGSRQVARDGGGAEAGGTIWIDDTSGALIKSELSGLPSPASGTIGRCKERSTSGPTSTAPPARRPSPSRPRPRSWRCGSASSPNRESCWAASRLAGRTRRDGPTPDRRPCARHRHEGQASMKNQRSFRRGGRVDPPAGLTPPGRRGEPGASGGQPAPHRAPLAAGHRRGWRPVRRRRPRRSPAARGARSAAGWPSGAPGSPRRPRGASRGEANQFCPLVLGTGRDLSWMPGLRAGGGRSAWGRAWRRRGGRRCAGQAAQQLFLFGDDALAQRQLFRRGRLGDGRRAGGAVDVGPDFKRSLQRAIVPLAGGNIMELRDRSPAVSSSQIRPSSFCTTTVPRHFRTPSIGWSCCRVGAAIQLGHAVLVGLGAADQLRAAALDGGKQRRNICQAAQGPPSASCRS